MPVRSTLIRRLAVGTRRSAALAVLLGALAFSGAGTARAQDNCGDSEGVSELQGAGFPVDLGAVRAFYELVDQPCVWDAASAITLIAAIESASDHGLDPALFHADELGRSTASSLFLTPAARDVLLTDGALKYAAAVAHGLSAPETPRDERAADAHPLGAEINSLAAALSRGDVAAWLDSLAPKVPGYERLKAALSSYRAIAEAGGWESLPPDLRLRPKKKSPFVIDLRRRLAMEGDLTRDDGGPVYDESVRAAVLRFQERNGLRADGKLDVKTIERLNVSAAERVAQISLNMERWRVDGRDLPPARVEVNVPDATAVLFRDGGPVLKMNAVVGAPGHDTPVLRSTINMVVVNPPWNIPRSIIQNEIKPILKRNPNYLTENRMYWSGDQLIQEPGPHNALGRIKFEFPNRFSVYLHDTPSRRLFTDPERAQSHGCVRLERPLDLAEALLQGDPEWSREAIEQAIREGETVRIALPEPTAVVISYRTAFVEEDGLVQFRPDIYGLDTQLTLALSLKVAALRSQAAVQ
ncbi:MAG: L,D-transpeptidase family protein [Alphaproteobacteria bacterium]|nr:L,D-transpeptidase family protein [Alphaproteobacteria bacterium]